MEITSKLFITADAPGSNKKFQEKIKNLKSLFLV